MLIKTTSLCDDCFKTAEKQCLEQQQNKPTQSNSTTSISNNSSQSPSTTSTVINNSKLAESMTSIEAASILPDDDGYCEIDEIRLPAITKSPSIKVKNDPRRQSAAAPLPPPPTPPPPSSLIEANNHELTDKTAESSNDLTANVDDKSKNNNENASNEQISKSTTDAEHIEVNYAYDSLAQPLAELNLNSASSENAVKLNNGAAKSRSATCESLFLPPAIDASAILCGTQHAIPSIPCHLISAYVASLNLHISQLLVSAIFFFNRV